jgi:hypothetical protein
MPLSGTADTIGGIGGKHDGALADFLNKPAMPSSARLKYGR